MAIQYKNADKLARAKTALLGKSLPDSVEAKVFQLCASVQDEEEKILCMYTKMGGAYTGTLKDEEDEADEETTGEEKPKKRGRPAKEAE